MRKKIHDLKVLLLAPNYHYPSQQYFKIEAVNSGFSILTKISCSFFYFTLSLVAKFFEENKNQRTEALKLKD